MEKELSSYITVSVANRMFEAYKLDWLAKTLSRILNIVKFAETSDLNKKIRMTDVFDMYKDIYLESEVRKDINRSLWEYINIGTIPLFGKLYDKDKGTIDEFEQITIEHHISHEIPYHNLLNHVDISVRLEDLFNLMDDLIKRNPEDVNYYGVI
jgi:hypothetical protein